MPWNRFDENARPTDDALAGTGENASGQVIPLEAAISARDTRKMHREAELTEQIIEEQKKRAEPVHLDGLKPLPADLRKTAVGPGIIPGGPDALGLAPSMRRTVPAPYRRDRIAIDHHGKSWSYVRAEAVEPGDIVADVGKVVQTASAVLYKDLSEIGEGSITLSQAYEFTGDKVAVGTEIRLVNVIGETRAFSPDEQVRVFRVHDS